MTKFKFAGTALRAAVAIGIAGSGITAAMAHPGHTMGGMQMAPGSTMDMKADKMDMKGKKMPAMKSAHHTQHAHHHHHKSAAK